MNFNDLLNEQNQKWAKVEKLEKALLDMGQTTESQLLLAIVDFIRPATQEQQTLYNTAIKNATQKLADMFKQK